MGFVEVLIALIVVGMPTIMVFAIVSRVYRHHEKKLGLEAQIAAAEAAQGNPKSAQLEQRVRVLERIVTDKGIVLADEIERLRDERVG